MIDVLFLNLRLGLRRLRCKMRIMVASLCLLVWGPIQFLDSWRWKPGALRFWGHGLRVEEWSDFYGLWLDFVCFVQLGLCSVGFVKIL